MRSRAIFLVGSVLMLVTGCTKTMYVTSTEAPTVAETPSVTETPTNKWGGRTPTAAEIFPDADLTDANLSGAELTLADLTGANLIGATMPNGSVHD